MKSFRILAGWLCIVAGFAVMILMSFGVFDPATAPNSGDSLMPIVVGDACGTTHPLHEQTLAQINDCYAPVVSTEVMIGVIERARRRNERAA